MRQIWRFTILLALALVFSAGMTFAQSEGVQRWNLDFGGGVTSTLGATHNNLSTGWNLSGGGGFNFTNNLGVAAQVMYDGLGVNPSVIQEFGSPGANSHLWGFSLDPFVRFYTSRKVGFYFIGGPGYYRRVINFTQPTTEIVTVFDPFFGFYPIAVPANQTIGTITRIGWGWNAGTGITYHVGSGNAKFFVEVRYHDIATRPTRTQVLPLTVGFRW